MLAAKFIALLHLASSACTDQIALMLICMRYHNGCMLRG